MAIFLITWLISACSSAPTQNAYESATPLQKAQFKKVMLPLSPETHFKISQGAFGKYTHHNEGHEYTWDFDVPLGTPVLSIDEGVVIQVWEPESGGGGCDPKYSDDAHTIKIRHTDGTVAQYVHVQSQVKRGDYVQKRQVVAVTALNGFICTPQLDFGVYQDDRHHSGSRQMRSIPLVFEGLPDGGMAHEGYRN